MAPRDIVDLTGWPRTDVDRRIAEWKLHGRSLDPMIEAEIARSLGGAFHVYQRSLEHRADQAKDRFRRLLQKTGERIPWDALETLSDFELARLIAHATTRWSIETQIRRIASRTRLPSVDTQR